jgi:four helix bundle protein
VRIDRFEDIESWQLARRLAKSVYAAIATNSGLSKDWGLKDQIARASGSVMHNIAEGFDGGSNREFIRFLHYAKRSCTEVQSELYMALDQNYVTQDCFQELYDLAGQTRARIKGFINYLNNHIDGPPSSRENPESPTRNPKPRTRNP